MNDAEHEPRYYNSLEYYLNFQRDWRPDEKPLLPYEPVAWRKVRGKYWTSWSFFGRYTWNNILKWTKRGDVYQVAIANGQLINVKRSPSSPRLPS